MSATTETRDGPHATPAVDDLVDMLAIWRRVMELELRVAAPAHVEKYMPATETVDVALGNIPILYVDGIEIPQLPIRIPAVPVAWHGSNTSRMTFPLAPGDTGYCIFMDRCIEPWLTFPAPMPADPVNGRAHHLGDAIFIPGLKPTAQPRVPPVNPAALTIDGPIVQLGAAATQFALRGTALAAACNIATLGSIAQVLSIVPEAIDPGTAATLANANAAAILALCALITASLSTKVQVE